MTGIIEWISGLVQQVKFWVYVRPWERCIRVRRGKHAKEIDAGVHWLIPLVDEVMLFNSKMRIASFPIQTLTTSDGQTVGVGGNVFFRIENPLAAVMSLQQPETSCAAIVQATAADYVCSRPLADIDRDELQLAAKADLERITDGLAIESVNITEFARVHRTFRILGDDWRPQTKVDLHDKEE